METSENALVHLPAGAGFSPDFVDEFRRRVGFEGLALLELLRQVTGRFDPVLVSDAKPGVSYEAKHRIVDAVQRAIRETAAGRALDDAGVERIWRPLVTAALEPGLKALRRALLDRDDPPAFVVTCRPGRPETMGGLEPHFWRDVKATEYEPADVGGRPQTPRVCLADSFDSYAHAIGSILLRLSRDHRAVTIRLEHCEDSLHELLTQP